MKNLIYYFTGTGNSLSVAKSFGGELISMPKHLDKSHLYEDETIGFVFPCYTGSFPTIVEKFIDNNEFKADYMFAIVTYGMVSIGTEEAFTKKLKEKGLSLDYVNKVRMVDTSLKFYEMEKQVKGLPKKNVNKQVEKIVHDVSTKKKRSTKNPILLSLSNRGYKSYREEIGTCDKDFTVQDHCNTCHVCEKVCPVNNITVDDGVIFHGDCIRCYACTQNCPQNAIRFKNEKSQARFRNENVSLREIIESNHVG